MKLGRLPVEGSSRRQRQGWRAAVAVVAVLGGALSNREALAEDNAPAPLPIGPTRALCDRPVGPARDGDPPPPCHLLPFPAFVPSALASTYVGVRIGGGYQTSPFQPFSTITGSYERVIGSGALELSKQVIANRLSFFSTLSGAVATGANTGTLLGSGSALGGGTDIGIAGAIPLPGAGQLALVGRVIQRNGSSLVVERALTALPQNPLNEKVIDVAGFLGTAAARIAVPYRESGQRFDLAWAVVATPLLSLQLGMGIEHRSRYFRPSGPYRLGDISQLIVPRLGFAVGLDLSSPNCGDPCVPIAFLVEYQLSPTHFNVEIPGTPLPVTTRFADHVVALGMHYTSDRHADLDAAITAYAELNVPPELALDPGNGLVPPRTTEIGAQAMARYFW